MEFHEVANIFPLLEGEEYRKLRDDIKANGLIEPIWTYESKILDGRNRYTACLDAGIEPRYKQYTGDEPIKFVLSLNLHRRHLNETQRGLVASRIANIKREDTLKVGSRSANLPIGSITQPEAAQMLNVSERTLRTVKAIERDAPDLVPLMEAGDMTASKATQVMRKREVIANLEDVQAKEVKAIQGVYDVIVIDPPWPMEKIERDVAPNQVAFEYPTMTEEELDQLEIPTADSCHVWLWTTHKFLPMALRLLNKWGLKYVCTFTWHKPGGFQPFGLPQYNCEFALYARKGSPIFIDTKDFPVCFTAPRGAHSEKPECFYDTVRRVTAGRRLDMFNRRSIDSFDTWGKEAV